MDKFLITVDKPLVFLGYPDGHWKIFNNSIYTFIINRNTNIPIGEDPREKDMPKSITIC